jgi:anaerobic magnesium-protoporphyrin IX monomethyl ester cyclase
LFRGHDPSAAAQFCGPLGLPKDAAPMKMNHLIVVPRIVNRVGDWYQFPLGIAYVSASLRKAGFALHTVNLNNAAGSVHDIFAHAIVAHDIGAVLTGGLTGQYGAIKQILEDAKRIRRDIVTIVGGGIVTSAPEHAMQALEFADYGVIGEGEATSCNLCAAIENQADVAQVPGLVFRCGAFYKRTGGPAAPVDIEGLPFPDYQAFGLDALLRTAPNIIGMCERNTLPIITSRG